MGSTTTSTADYLVKYLYADGLDEEALVSSNALLAYVERDRNFTSSKGKVIAAPTTNGQGGYVTNADAYAARAGALGVNFTVPVRRLMHVGALQAEVVRLAEAGGDESQFASALTRDIDGATEAFGQELNQRLYGRSLGERARVHATTAISATVLTLANPEDAAFFAQDMRVSAVDPATGLIRDSGDFVTLVNVDPIAGTLTADAPWSNIASIALGDILIRWGTLNASLDGLAGWCPETANLSSNFLGVNQNINRTTVAGVYVDVSSYAIRPGLLRAAAVAEGQLGRGFSKNAPIFVNPADKFEIVASVEAVKVVETSMSTKYNIGLDVVEVLGCTLVSDRHCPVGRAFQVKKGSFTLGSAGNQPGLDDIDGRTFLYQRQTGSMEFAMAFDGNSYSEAVNTLMHIKLPTRTTP